MSAAQFRLAPLAAALAAIFAMPAYAAPLTPGSVASTLPATAAEAASVAGADSAGANAADASAEAEAAERRRPTKLATVEVRGEVETAYSAKKTITATKTDTLLRDIPQAITVVTQALIRDQAMQGTADVVRYVPGVGMAQGEGNRDTPIFRGSASTADLFVDGMRDDVQYFRDLYNIDRVEVLKGPNAMMFGRGGSGGLVNRVSKRADFETVRSVGLQVGSWDRQRLSVDLGQGLSQNVAGRVTAVAEDAGSFRDGVSARRRGISPTFAWSVGERTTVDISAEHFEETRTADRGISSINGRPVDVDADVFFGDPDRSTAQVDVDAFNLLIEHEFENGALLRNRTRYAVYDKFYQNIYPGAAFGNGLVAISAYDDTTQRDNLFNQTDLVWDLQTGAVKHKLLAGFEWGRQETDSLRQTGVFPANFCPGPDGSATTSSTCVPISDPRYTGPITFGRAGDADRKTVARIGALYVQDQIEFSPSWQAVLGLRHDRFEVDLLNNVNDQHISSSDDLLSPRVGLIYKPFSTMSLYASYSIAFQPRSGEQLGSLTPANASLEPEKFRNYELGAKWDFHPDLALTAALYQLDRSNVAVVDPLDPSKLILLEGHAQRVQGVELAVSGKLSEKWSVMGGLAYQDAVLSADQHVLPQVPRRSFSLWNRYDVNDQLGFGLGVVARSQVFTSTSNNVVLPGYARLDAAVFYRATETLRLQLNVENLLDRDYYVSAHNDNNISPGSPRAFNLGINLDF